MTHSNYSNIISFFSIAYLTIGELIFHNTILPSLKYKRNELFSTILGKLFKFRIGIICYCLSFSCSI